MRGLSIIIRLGFYMQYGKIKGLEYSNDTLLRRFLVLIIVTANGVNSLQPLEMYAVLLLRGHVRSISGIIPIYTWRLLTGCDTYSDLTQWLVVDLGRRCHSSALRLSVIPG